MSLIKRITVTEANREFTKLLKAVDDNNMVMLTKMGRDKYVVLSKKAFNEVKEDIMRDFVLDNEYIEKIKKYGTFRDDRDRICKLWLENNRVKILKIEVDEEGFAGTFQITEVLPERIGIEKDEGGILVNVSSIEGDTTKVRMYDADEIGADDYEAMALVGMTDRILSVIEDPEELPKGRFSGTHILEI